MMEVHFTPELEKTLNDMAALRGLKAGELVQELVLASLGDFRDVRAMIESRYDDLKSGRAKSIDGEEAFARLRTKSEQRRSRSI